MPRKFLQINKKWLVPLFIILYVSLIVMAIDVAISRHESHRLFTELRQLEKERDNLKAEWSRLRLEKSTILNQIHVGEKARRQLNMVMPKGNKIQVIKE